MCAARPTLLALSGVRLLLAYHPWTKYLKDDHLLVSPLTSFSRLQEGLYLFQHSIDPYTGGLFRQSPLLLSVFSTVFPLQPFTTPLLWTICDAAAAWFLLRIWEARNKGSSSNRSWIIIATYMLNPYIVFPNLAFSTASLENLILVATLYFSVIGVKSTALLLLAIGTHLSLTPMLLALPISMVIASHSASQIPLVSPGQLVALLPFITEFTLYTTLLAAISTLVAGNLNWVSATWGSLFFLPDLTPNVGLWWYFFTEMFDHFRPFFLVVFSVNMLIYVLPLCIKFRHDPLYATFLLIGIIAMFKPYPTLADSGLFLSMTSLFPEIYPYLSTPIVTTLLHLHASLLLPLFNRLWLADGTGNANFFYASTLVFALANGFAITDCIWAGIHLVFGKGKEGWTLVQIYNEKAEKETQAHGGAEIPNT